MEPTKSTPTPDNLYNTSRQSRNLERKKSWMEKMRKERKWQKGTRSRRYDKRRMTKTMR